MGIALAHRWNRCLGWALLVAGFISAIWLDPWSLSERDPAAVVGSVRMALRHAQAVVLGMAFLQLATSLILSSGAFSLTAERWASALSAIGALVYVAGYAAQKFWPPASWLIVAGAFGNCLAFAELSLAPADWSGRQVLRIILLVFCLGMALDAAMGFFAIDAQRFQPAYLGAEDGVRMRMLRLARAAVIALSVLALLYRDLEQRCGDSRLARWGRWALVAGAAGMPLTLAIAAFTVVEVKYLLGLPAQATFLGTLAGTWLAYRRARPLEVWGWAFVAASMQVGLLMGLYAFEGPVPAPSFLGSYNDFPRRLSRLGHAYAIILGVLGIFLSRDIAGGRHPVISGRLGVPLLIGGSIASELFVLLVAAADLPTSVLAVGPAVIAVGLVVCLLPARSSCERA